MVDELKSLGIELMVTFWPFMGMPCTKETDPHCGDSLHSAPYKGAVHWEEYESKGFLAQNISSGKPDSWWRYNTPSGNALVDATSKEAMKATFGHWYEGYGKYGIRALWLDEAEPDRHGYTFGEWKLRNNEKEQITDAEVVPAWVKGWTDGFADGMASIGAEPGEYFILTRNMWTGTWKNGAALWSGDIGSRFEILAGQVRAGQGAAMSGIPLWTTDIGGYTGGDPTKATFQQLIVRWFQFGAFCPLFRLHGHRIVAHAVPQAHQCGATNGDNEVWNLAKDEGAEHGHYAGITKVMHLREDLRDYVLRLNNHSVHTGMPMMRPLFLQFAADKVCGEGKQVQQLSQADSDALGGQFTLGDDWLVNPVTVENATSWRSYLPELPPTHEWVYWWNQTQMKAGSWVNTSTPIDEFPLFFRCELSAGCLKQANQSNESDV